MWRCTIGCKQKLIEWARLEGHSGNARRIPVPQHLQHQYRDASGTDGERAGLVCASDGVGEECGPSGSETLGLSECPMVEGTVSYAGGACHIPSVSAGFSARITRMGERKQKSVASGAPR